MESSELISSTNEQVGSSKQEIIEICVYGLCILLFSLGLLFNYGYVAQSLSMASFDRLFWDPLAIVGGLTNLFSSFLIIINMYHNFINRNYFEKHRMPNQSILYLICLPTLVLILVGSCFVVMKEIIINDNSSIGKEIFSFSSIILFLSILSLLIETNMYKDCGEKWSINLLNMTTILFTIISLINNLIYPILIDQIDNFTSALNITIESDLYNELYLAMKNLFDLNFILVYKIIIIFNISCIFFLINPLVFHFNNLQQSKFSVCVQASEVIGNNDQPKLSNISLVLSFLFIVTISVSIIIDYTKQSVELINLLIVATYVASFFHIYIILSDIKKCPRKDKVNSIHYIFMWLGLFGQFIQSISGLHVAFRLMNSYPTENYWTRILQYITQVIESFAQNICLTLIIERKWMPFNKKQWYSFLSCPLFLVCTNIGFMLFTFYNLYKREMSFNSPEFHVRLFESGFNNLGMIFSVLHRCHGAIVYVFYFKYYIINDPVEYVCNL